MKDGEESPPKWDSRLRTARVISEAETDGTDTRYRIDALYVTRLINGDNVP